MAQRPIQLILRAPGDSFLSPRSDTETTLIVRNVVAVMILAAGITVPLLGQDGGATSLTVSAFRLPDSIAGSHITLDGVLNEPQWSQAPTVSGFRQREPDEGQPATERTEVRIVFDRETLYVGDHGPRR